MIDLSSLRRQRNIAEPHDFEDSDASVMEKGLSADDGRERLAGEIGDGEEDAALYSDVGRHGKKKSRDDDDGFVDSAIRRKR